MKLADILSGTFLSVGENDFRGNNIPFALKIRAMMYTTTYIKLSSTSSIAYSRGTQQVTLDTTHSSPSTATHAFVMDNISVPGGSEDTGDVAEERGYQSVGLVPRRLIKSIILLLRVSLFFATIPVALVRPSLRASVSDFLSHRQCPPPVSGRP